ncbi:uncharacterized protein LOC129567627 [Sitodiplosis mosellana]|uniref:uncharacterized protein LOC129567627 n=1 Tax=Sitodiplosis mosellana TaxID=263140 RepID=UPI00244446BE|nr:uncharacterized protein LOC129567627 [Sitodiplosis mosellana]
MNKANKKNKRLCETLKLLNGIKVGQEVEKERHVKVKQKSKKNSQNTFSMINFYQSIPKYDEIRHLPEYDFSERVDLLKKIHCDLSETLLCRPVCKRPVSQSTSRCSKRKTSAKKKKCSANRKSNLTPSLCNSFSKASLLELNELESGSKKKSPVDRIPSANSLNMSTPPHIKRLQTLRERLLAGDDDWNYESKLPTPTMLSPMCSPNLYFRKPHEVQPRYLHKELHFHDFDPYPCDHFHNAQPIIHIQEVHSPTQNPNYIHSPPKQMIGFASEFKSVCKTPTCEEKLLTAKKKVRRAKSCPNDWFSPSSMDNGKRQNECVEMDYSQEYTPWYSNESNASPTIISRQQNAYAKSDGKIKSKPKSKTSNSMDEFLSSKLVRCNLAASLRHKNSRKKINEFAEEKLKESMDVSKFIPKCHHWNVRDTPAWKTFTSEDTTVGKRMREEARREEQKVRKHTHAMTMNIMRARVKSAQLLLEGRSLSAK